MTTPPLALACSTSQERRNGQSSPLLFGPSTTLLGLTSEYVYRDAWTSVKGVSKEEAWKLYVEKLISVRYGTNCFCVDLFRSSYRALVDPRESW